MAPRVPAFLQGAALPAGDLRLADSGLLVPTGQLTNRSGVFPSAAANDLKVTAPGGLIARVAPGRCAIQGTEATAGGMQGPYLCANDANVDLAIAPTAAGQLRVDLIVARINDAAYSGAVNSFTLEVVQGVPAAAAPAEPAAPASTLVLARIDVPAAAGAIVAGNITDRRLFTAAAGGIVPCTSTSRPGTPYQGQVVYEADTDRLVRWDGAAWRIAKWLGSMAGFTPVWTASTTNPVVGNGTWDARYKQEGSMVDVVMGFTFGSTTTLGSGTWTFGLPILPNNRGQSNGGVYLARSGGWRIGVPRVIPSPAGVQIVTTDSVSGAIAAATYAWAAGDKIEIGATYLADPAAV